jgi:Mannosyl-glycoprotein endo-beta-N-acetylglucosaminidase
MRRVILPLLFLTTTTVVAGCMQQASVNQNATPRVFVPAPTPTQSPSAGLGQDDLRLDMNSVAGLSPVDISATAVQVLPAGKVPESAEAVQAVGKVTNTTVTRWVKNTAETTLWSGADAHAAAFTQLPAASYLKVIGPDDAGRTPVYYVGDGLMRKAGNGWVDASSVATVDAPAPGQVPAVDADAQQPLPQWVQAHQATRLWSGPDDEAVSLTDLPQWTFLKVAGLERSGRLLVNYAGDYASRQPGIGWVDQSAVGPAGDPGRWITNHRTSALWSGTDEKATRFTDIPQWTKLRIVEGAPADAARLEIEFFGDGRSKQPGTAWIARADVGPITPPVPLPAAAAAKVAAAAISTGQGQQIETRTFASTAEFIESVGAAAQRSMRSTSVPASVTVAQAILESDWGRSRLTRQGNNLFGIKALGGVAGPAGVVTLATWEHLGGGDVVVQAPFRAYYTLEQSIDDHGRFFTSNKRYAGALAVAGDARAFAQAVQDAGYATDPGYASKLIGLMDRYNLYRFDS